MPRHGGALDPMPQADKLPRFGQPGEDIVGQFAHGSGGNRGDYPKLSQQTGS